MSHTPELAEQAQPDSREHVAESRKDHRAPEQLTRIIWEHVSHSPLRNLWDLQGVPLKTIAKRAGKSFLDDNLVSRAAELGYYFLFALFPTLVCASSILGLAARSASKIYVELLNYLSLVVPPSAYRLVIDTFNQTTAASSGGKVLFGIAAALWSASVGFSSIQDGMNVVYKVKETRPYWKARGAAILVTVLLSVIVTLILGTLLLGDLCSRHMYAHFYHRWIGGSFSVVLHVASWIIATALLLVLFGVIYYYGPDLKTRCWRWVTPGSTIAIGTWVLASMGLRVYLHFFNSYSLTYGSLGAVIILLTWFYVTGLTLLLGAEVNSEIQAAVAERHLKERGELPREASAEPDTEASVL